jgi:hypothetical protein
MLSLYINIQEVWRFFKESKEKYGKNIFAKIYKKS